jgi:hypothetical protein
VSSFDNFELTASGELKFVHLASYYDFGPRPEEQISWFSFDNRNGERQPLNSFDPAKLEGYYVAVLSSVEGKVEVYFRNLGGESRIVGVERQ